MYRRPTCRCSGLTSSGLARNELAQQFHRGDGRAEFGIDGGHFQPDDAASLPAEDGEMGDDDPCTSALRVLTWSAQSIWTEPEYARNKLTGEQGAHWTSADLRCNRNRHHLRAACDSEGRPIMTFSYYAPTGGLPGQTELTTNRAVFTEAYAVLPRGTMRDIVTSLLPFWDETRLWVIARPLSGFAETFSQYIVEVLPGGGSDYPEADPGAEGVLFLLEGSLVITLDDERHELSQGGYAFIPPGADWQVHATGEAPAKFHWIRKAYQRVHGIDMPAAFFTSDAEIEGIEMAGTDGAWTTQRFADPTVTTLT